MRPLFVRAVVSVRRRRRRPKSVRPVVRPVVARRRRRRPLSFRPSRRRRRASYVLPPRRPPFVVVCPLSVWSVVRPLASQQMDDLNIQHQIYHLSAIWGPQLDNPMMATHILPLPSSILLPRFHQYSRAGNVLILDKAVNNCSANKDSFRGIDGFGRGGNWPP